MYPEKDILDVAGFPVVKGKDLVSGLVAQAATADPTYLLGRTALTLEVAEDETWGVHVGLDDGTQVHARAVIITAGIGKFTPRPLPAAETWTGDGVAFFVPSFAQYAEQGRGDRRGWRQRLRLGGGAGTGGCLGHAGPPPRPLPGPPADRGPGPGQQRDRADQQQRPPSWSATGRWRPSRSTDVKTGEPPPHGQVPGGGGCAGVRRRPRSDPGLGHRGGEAAHPRRLRDPQRTCHASSPPGTSPSTPARCVSSLSGSARRRPRSTTPPSPSTPRLTSSPATPRKAEPMAAGARGRNPRSR